MSQGCNKEPRTPPQTGKKSNLGRCLRSLPWNAQICFFWGACSTHSALACGKLGCPLLKLAPGIILHVLANSILPTQASDSARKIKSPCPFPSTSLSLRWTWRAGFQSTREGEESLLVEVSPPFWVQEAAEEETVQAGKRVLGTPEQLISPLDSELGAESVMYYSEIRIQLSLDFFWSSSCCCLDMN